MAPIPIIALVLLGILGVLLLVLIIRKPLSGLIVLLLLAVAGGVMLPMMLRSQRRSLERQLLKEHELASIQPPGTEHRTTVQGGVYVGPEGVRVSLPGNDLLNRLRRNAPADSEARIHHGRRARLLCGAGVSVGVGRR